MIYLALYYLAGLLFQYWAMRRCGLTLTKLSDEIGASRLPCGAGLICVVVMISPWFWPLGILTKPPAGLK